MSELNKAISVSRNFESALMEKDKRFAKFGWVMVALLGFLLILAIVAIIIMQPLKTTLVELYTIDKKEGRIEYMTTVKDSELSSDDALNMSFTASYVKRREGYNYFALQNDYDETQLFNSDDVNREYLAWFNGTDAPDIVYGNAAKVVTVDVLSNVQSEGTGDNRTALVRIKRTIRQIANGNLAHDYWTVRLTYHYVPHKELTSSQREVNPLGFIVTSYQLFKDKSDE